MKKSIVIVALALLASASFSTVEAAKKKDKKKKTDNTEATTLPPVVLSSSSDSVSYAAGMVMTNGLMPSTTIVENGIDIPNANTIIINGAHNFGLSDLHQMRGRVGRGNRKAFCYLLAPPLAALNPESRRRLEALENFSDLGSGINIAMQVENTMLPRALQEFHETPDSIVEELVYRAFTDAVMGDTTVMETAWAETFFKEKQKVNRDAKVAQQTAEGRRFLAENAKKEGVITTPSGLQYKVLKQGNGNVPQASDRVLVHYEGRLIDGTVFDASSKHGTEPSKFRANQVIRGWTEALTMMPVGSKWQLYIPYDLAYGERGQGQIPAYATLIFDVELVGIEK